MKLEARCSASSAMASTDCCSCGPLRILLLIDNLDLGGAQKLVEIQAKTMQSDLHAIRVVNLGAPNPLSNEMRASGVDVVDVELRRLADFSGLRRATKAICDWRPDIIHANLNHSILLGGALAGLCGARLVVTLHNEVPDEAIRLYSRVKVGLETLVLQYVADQIIGCGPRVIEGQKPRLGGRVVNLIVNRVLPVEEVSPDERLSIRREFGCEDGLIFLAVGRLSRQKGFDVLIKAFARADFSLQNVRLVIVGAGEDRDRLTGLIAKARQDRIVLAGLRIDVRHLLKAADVFILSSRWEGLPLVLLEAMASGLPIIATRVGDVVSVTGEEGAILVEAEDVEGLADAISFVAENSELRRELGAVARRAVAKYTDVPAFVSELQDVYGRTLSTRV